MIAPPAAYYGRQIVGNKKPGAWPGGVGVAGL